MTPITELIEAITYNNKMSYLQICSNDEYFNINELKGMEFSTFMQRLNCISSRDLKFQYFTIYFAINDRPIFNEVYDYNHIKAKLIHKIKLFKYNQIYLITHKNGTARQIKPLIVSNEKFEIHSASYLFRKVLSNLEDGEDYSLILKTKSNTPDFHVIYMPILFKLMQYNQEFNIQMEDFILINDTKIQNLLGR